MKKVYLAGRMSADPKDQEWRIVLAPFLVDLGYEVLDPYLLEPEQLKGLKLEALPKGMKTWEDLRYTNDPEHFARFQKCMQAIIRFDINIVMNTADIIIVRWSKNCSTGAGTHSELTYAFLNNKPVYLIEESEVPGWVDGCVTKKFKNVKELKNFLKGQYDN